MEGDWLMAIRKLFEKVAKAIKWEHIDDNAVRENTIQDASVTEPKYASNSIPERAFRQGAVSNRALASSSVGENQVQNGAITPNKLSGGAKDKALIGLGNVDNTSDINKPISSAAQSALDGKEPRFAAGSLSQYLRGDKTFVRLDTTAVMAQTNSATGNLNNFTSPGVYMYQSATNLPPGAGNVGTLTVTSNTEQQRSQLLTDSNGFAWTRGYNGTAWSQWHVLTQGATPLFFGSMRSQRHPANSTERCNYGTVTARFVTNSHGQLTVARAGGYIIQAYSAGPWVSRASGWGRQLMLHHNGLAQFHSFTDAPILWGDSVGSWNVSATGYMSMNVGDTIEVALHHSTNQIITADHHVWISGVG